jgi:hypothetical protein
MPKQWQGSGAGGVSQQCNNPPRAYELLHQDEILRAVQNLQRAFGQDFKGLASRLRLLHLLTHSIKQILPATPLRILCNVPPRAH